MSLALRLKTTRKKLGLSQAELARQVNVSQPTIANWERGGHIPRQDALGRIASALGTDPAWLVSGEMPADINPAHMHLAKPIHHIPVYEWPLELTDPTTEQPSRYMAVAADVTGMFGLDADGSTPFPQGSILVFSRSDKRAPGQFLTRGHTRYDLVERDSVVDDVFARLVYSVVPH